MENETAAYRFEMRLRTILYVNSIVCGHLLVILAAVLHLLQRGPAFRLALGWLVLTIIAAWWGSGQGAAGRDRRMAWATACAVAWTTIAYALLFVT